MNAHDQNCVYFIDDAGTFGGAQIAMAYAAQVIISETNWNVTIVCTKSNEEKILAYIDAYDIKFKIITFPSTSFLFLPKSIYRFLNLFKDFEKKSEGKNFYILNLSGIEFCIAPLIASKILALRTCTWLHNPERLCFFSRNGSITRKILSRIRDLFADKFIFPAHFNIRTPSYSTANTALTRMKGIRNKSVTAMYPTVPLKGIQFDLYDNDPQIFDQNSSIRLVLIGRIEISHKNSLKSLDALFFLRAAGRGAKLTVIGDGPDIIIFKKHAMELGLTEHVEYLGWRVNPWIYIEPSSIVLIPSFFEGFPLVAIEAMQRNIRIVVSPIDSFFEGVPNILISNSFATEDFAETVYRASNINASDLRELYDDCLVNFSPKEFISSFSKMNKI